MAKTAEPKTDRIEHAKASPWTKVNYKVLHDESDRGCVLVAAAMLDEQLGELFQIVLRDGTAEHLLKQDAALGSFSRRIDMAHALGLIDEEFHHDLHIVRKIRNDAAHFERRLGHETGFDSQPTSQRVRELNYVKKVHMASPEFEPFRSDSKEGWRLAFCMAISAISGYLMGVMRVHQIAQEALEGAPLERRMG
jgi:DNA-binding MltR family transcriptional regulator